jgi:hypothetical protein
LPGLRSDLAGGVQQLRQVLSRSGEPAAPTSSRRIVPARGCQLGGFGAGSAQRSFRVG